MKVRCEYCEKGRLDSKPCQIAQCLCRCHREGVAAIERQTQAFREVARKQRRAPGNALLIQETLAPMSFEQEYGAPRPSGRVIPFRTAKETD